MGISVGIVLGQNRKRLFDKIPLAGVAQIDFGSQVGGLHQKNLKKRMSSRRSC